MARSHGIFLPFDQNNDFCKAEDAGKQEKQQHSTSSLSSECKMQQGDDIFHTRRLPKCKHETRTIQELSDWMKADRITANPIFARESGWRPQEQTEYIASLFYAFGHLSPLVFNRIQQDERHIIDGKQRLLALLNFLDGAIPVKDPLTGLPWYYSPDSSIEDPRILPEEARKRFLDFSINLCSYDNLTPEQEAVIICATAQSLPSSQLELGLLSASPASLYVKSVQEEFLFPETYGGLSRSFDRILGYHKNDTSTARVHRTWACLAKATEYLANNASFDYVDDSSLNDWLASGRQPNNATSNLLQFLLRRLMELSMQEYGRVDLEDGYHPTHESFTNQGYLAPSEFIFIPYLLHVTPKMSKGQQREAVENFRKKVRERWPSDVPNTSDAWAQLRNLAESIKQEDLKGIYHDPAEQQRGTKRSNRSSLGARALSLSNKRSKIDVNGTRNISPVSSESPAVPFSNSEAAPALQIHTPRPNEYPAPEVPTQPRSTSRSHQSPTVDPRTTQGQQTSPRVSLRQLPSQRTVSFTESPITSPNMNTSPNLPDLRDPRSRSTSADEHGSAFRSQNGPPLQKPSLQHRQPSRASNSEYDNDPRRPEAHIRSNSAQLVPASTMTANAPLRESDSSRSSLPSILNSSESTSAAPLAASLASRLSMPSPSVPGSTPSDTLGKVLATIWKSSGTHSPAPEPVHFQRPEPTRSHNSRPPTPNYHPPPAPFPDPSSLKVGQVIGTLPANLPPHVPPFWPMDACWWEQTPQKCNKGARCNRHHGPCDSVDTYFRYFGFPTARAKLSGGGWIWKTRDGTVRAHTQHGDILVASLS